jgi:hypothetical protein
MSEAVHADAAKLPEMLAVEVGNLEDYPDLLGDMYRRRYLGAIVRRVFEPERMAELRRRLSDGVEGVPRAVAPTFKGGLYGSPLAVASDDLRDYLENAARFRTAIAPFFSYIGGLETRIESVLARISGGLPVEVAGTDDGREYLPASVRVLIEGDSLPIHYENGTTRGEGMKQLLPHIDTETIMSFYVPVALAEEGGVLEVFTTDCSGDGHRIIGDLGGPERARSILAERGYMEVLPAVGDMLVFDGGRHYHLVTEIRRGARWTLGGFVAFAKDHRRVVYWS